ncbi:MAG: hypothetical protein KKH94_05445 [Candidatus Omnitrophica bacterium]|nr:hypothetical protein [Candidatus Omnitrophota bacterium]
MSARVVGLTDNPDQMKQVCGNPKDWQQCVFSTEEDAEAWLKRMLEQTNCTPGKEKKGWKYGYTYLNQENQKKTS